MIFNRKNLQILDKIGMLRLAFQEASIPLNKEYFSNDINDYLHSKNVVLSGQFFPMNENSFIDNLEKQEANLEPEITPDTEILICGRYPDWMLVEEARLYGIKIVFADKAGELFSRMATKLYKNRAELTYEDSPGV